MLRHNSAAPSRQLLITRHHRCVKYVIAVISDYRTRGLEQTAALITAHRKIGRITLENVGPFYCNVEMTGDSHVGKPRFQPGGYPLQKQPVPESVIPVSKSENGREKDTLTKEKVPRTAGFDFG